ncbi:Uncharacterised protein [Mycobacteroides abscessus subsp. abscessus]|nr:Uncharacterised protein [Mycobacteroides abscessus subsp. abscessus]
MQALDAFFPLIPVDEVVPLRDQIAQRTTVVAERDTAVHAAAGLGLQLRLVEVVVDLFPVHQPQVDRTPLGQFTLGVLEESSGVSHVRPP